MSLSNSTLVAIQKAGAAVFAADEKLKQEAKNYADRVNVAMTSNPGSLGNDALIESWKTVARLSQTLAGIEAEIKKVFQLAATLASDDQPSVAIAPKKTAKPTVVVPAAKVKKARISTPVAAAPAKVAAKPKGKVAAPKAKVIAAKRATVKAQPGELSGNAAKLLPQLELVLNTNDFVEISQTAIGKEADIALGSMTAALKKLMDLGRITTGPAGSYKLAAPVVTAVTPEAVAS
jgi:hypothetical protein